MAKLTPQQIGEKYASRTSAATSDWLNGIQSTTEAPGQKAAAAADKWAARTAESKAKFAARAGATSLQAWQQAAAAKQSRYSQGTQAGASKMVAFQSEFQPFQQAVTAKVRSMPSTTLEQRLERARVQAIETAKFQRRG